jgi:ferredoxin
MARQETRIRRKTIEITEARCLRCGDWYERVREHAKFCSDACRVAAHRAKNPKKTKKKRDY